MIHKGGDEWGTPQWLFDYAERRWGPFDVDLAASAQNHKCPKYYTKENSSLELNSWFFGKAWCNPPYSRGNLPAFIGKAIEARYHTQTVLLVPADTSTKWFKAAWEAGADVTFIHGRVTFEGAIQGAKFGSAFIVLGPDTEGGKVDLCAPRE